MTYRVIKGDVLRFCEHYKEPKFHACLTDAPYEISFMNQSWDGSGVSFNSDTWHGISNLLLPGAFLFVLVGTVNNDLISVAMREAGLRKYHEILGWATGSGFPKATRIDTQVDRAAGAEREEIGQYIAPDGKPRGMDKGIQGGKYGSGNTDYCAERMITAPTTPLAQAWEGHRYGGQMMKPALETVLVFSKPYKGKPVDCITETGAGALWIEGGRIGTGDDRVPSGESGETAIWSDDGGNDRLERPKGGRWPANFYLSHMPECICLGTKKVKGSFIEKPSDCKTGTGATGNWGAMQGNRGPRGHGDSDGLETVPAWNCHPDCPVRRLSEQSGHLKSGHYSEHRNVPKTNTVYRKFKLQGESPTRSANEGTASRFFYQSHWMYERLEQANPVFYTGKATRKERDIGLSGMPLKTRNRVNPGGLENEPRWAPVQARNTHPTVKSISLTKWLATLLLPLPEYAPRRLLVPFCGSGSEIIGALLAGWEEVIGIELIQENVDIARARIAWWQQWVELGCTDVDTILKDGVSLEKEISEGQLTLF